MKFIYSFMILLISFSAFSQNYTCSDQSKLEQTLRDLRARCGGSSTSFCRANGRVGSTPQEALRNCFLNTSYTESQCGASLTCSGVSFCKARGRIGNTISEALKNCYANTSYTESECESDLSCTDVTYCRARGRVGSTFQEAIQKCYQNTSYTQAECEADVTCY